MASIYTNLKKIHTAVVKARIGNDDPGVPSPLSTALNNAAVEALTGGIDSPAWVKYMAIFADNPEQLERLTKPKENEPSYLRQMRAYIVSNAICFPDTNAFLDNRVTKLIDGGSNNDPQVSDQESDPNGELAAVGRPQGLDAIPMRDIPEA